MRLLSRRGMTLFELLLAITLLGLLGAGVTTMVRAAGLVTLRAVAGLGAERTLTTTGTFLRHELRDAKWSDLRWSSDTIRFARRVGETVVCWGGGTEARVAQSDWSGDRAPDPARDYVAGLTTASIWVEIPLVAVSPTTCPDGRPAWRLTLALPADSLAIIRVMEPVLLRNYRSGTSDWLGLAPGGGMSPVQPFAGPLRAVPGRFGRVGDALSVDLGTRVITIPLDSGP